MEALENLADNFNYWVYIVIMMIGLYAMVSKNNLIKKLIGMSIFQTAIILFYVSIGYKDNATIPILYHDQVHGAHHVEEGYDSHDADHGPVHVDAHDDHSTASDHVAEAAHAIEADHGDSHGELVINPEEFGNPLVHVLMLTAIVVGVATLGVGLAITQKLYSEFGTIEEHEIIDQLRSSND